MARPARRRGRTTLLVAVAAVLGVVAGTCTGFVVQANREPTALPPLSQPVVKQAKGEVEPLSAAQDRHVKIDGDLRKLLLKKPKGARAADYMTNGWMDLAEYADNFDKPATAFGNLATDEFRRAAVIGWRESGNSSVVVQLVQFRQVRGLTAEQSTSNEQSYAGDESDTDSWPIPGTGDGWVYVHHSPDRKPGYLPLYTAEALATRGDIAVTVWVFDSKPITKKKIMDLAKRQMGRL
ncbi:hypothetical protein [Streptomyces justiciae]|uniref:hypothetical protein n=1 Tax=Streptomyces justiciae TaxID=2780140 RepID=UPI00187F16F2|nr:hypothetical protein [Streptomyces justiciae]MBE8478235.1 hypothetical protein [Streptomyces justiciae]MCW8375732.1 hypothetical protein [Streptomyces justiciae]